jgi:hypothetical protein
MVQIRVDGQEDEMTAIQTFYVLNAEVNRLYRQADKILSNAEDEYDRRRIRKGFIDKADEADLERARVDHAALVELGRQKEIEASLAQAKYWGEYYADNLDRGKQQMEETELRAG